MAHRGEVVRTHGGHRLTRLRTWAGRWWPVLAIIATSLVIQELVLAGNYPRGHAADHRESAKVVFFGAAMVAVIMWAAPRARRQLDVLVVAAAWLAALGGVAIGNLRVVDAIGDADWSNEEADTFGAGVDGFQSGHDLAGVAMLLAVGAAIVFAGVLFARGHVSRNVAIGSAVLSVVFPPFIIAGAGIVVLAVAVCVSRHRRFSHAVH